MIRHDTAWCDGAVRQPAMLPHSTEQRLDDLSSNSHVWKKSRRLEGESSNCSNHGEKLALEQSLESKMSKEMSKEMSALDVKSSLAV